MKLKFSFNNNLRLNAAVIMARQAIWGFTQGTARFTRRFLSISVLGVLFVISASSQEAVFPSRAGYVVDTASIIDQPTVAKIESINYELKKLTGAEIILVTVNTAGALEPTAYLKELQSRWSEGTRTLDHTAIILISVIQAREDVILGSAMDQLVSQSEAQELCNNRMLMPLSQGRFSLAAQDGVTALAEHIKNRYYGVGPQNQAMSLTNYLLIAIALVILLSILLRASLYNMFGGVVGATCGYLFVSQLYAIIIGAAAGFLLGYTANLFKKKEEEI